MSERYTAVIKIVKVETTPPPPRGNVPGAEHTKDTELASIVVRNGSLASLIEKAKAHLDLVEEN